MSSPQILDLATLLAPLPGDNPVGESLFYTDTYDVIKEARRADALARLTAVAAYFRRAEPQTLAIYLIKRAVRQVQMPLEAWLQTVIRDDSVLTAVRDTLGLMEAVEDNT